MHTHMTFVILLKLNNIICFIPAIIIILFYYLFFIFYFIIIKIFPID